MQKLNSMTPEQEAQMIEYRQNWMKIGHSSDPLDLYKVEEIAEKLYGLIDKSKPSIVRCQSPWQMVMTIAAFKEIGMVKGSNLGDNLWNNLGDNLSEIVRQEYSWWTFYGSWYLYWLSFYDFPRKFLRPEIYSKKGNEQLDTWIDLAHNVAGWAAYEGVFFVCERPTVLKLDSNNRLHCTDGPAIQYVDGLEFYYLHGIYIENTEYITGRLTTDQIDQEKNVEVKRVLIDKYGQSEYLMDSGAQKIHEDDFGVLYKKDIGDDEPIMMVKVVNSSKEPDGTYKDYFLGVDPKSYGGLKTAQAAVASTWRYEDHSKLVFEDWRQYRPLIET